MSLVTMYDSVTPAHLPANADAVAGYCDANFAGVWIADVHRFPELSLKQRVVSIATRVATTARIMDIEAGNPTTPAQGAEWVVRMVAHGVYRPGIYASDSQMSSIRAAMARTALKRSQFVLWTASWNGTANAQRLLAEGYDAVQYTDHGANGCDESLCKPEFFPVDAPAPPVPAIPQGVANASLAFDVHTKRWNVTGTPSAPIKWERAPGREASALLKLNTSNGHWSVSPLPWNFKTPG